jgi:hypothetical protein
LPVQTPKADDELHLPPGEDSPLDRVAHDSSRGRRVASPPSVLQGDGVMGDKGPGSKSKGKKPKGGKKK